MTDDRVDASLRALIEETARKSAVLWLRVGDRRERAAWHVWSDGAIYLVTGGREQSVPGLGAELPVRVLLRSKDTGGRLVAFDALVEEVHPGSETWARVVPELHAKRLNPPDGERQPERWAAESRVWRLTPTGSVPERPGHLPSRSHAAPPPGSPATTVGTKPMLLGRRPRPR